MAGVVWLLTDPQQGIIAMAACAQDGNQRMPGVGRTVVNSERSKWSGKMASATFNGKAYPASVPRNIWPGPAAQSAAYRAIATGP